MEKVFTTLIGLLFLLMCLVGKAQNADPTQHYVDSIYNKALDEVVKKLADAKVSKLDTHKLKSRLLPNINKKLQRQINKALERQLNQKIREKSGLTGTVGKTGSSIKAKKWNYVYEFDFQTGKGEWYRYDDTMGRGKPVLHNVLLFNRNMRIHVTDINAGRFLLDIENKPNYYQFNSADAGNDAVKNPEGEKDKTAAKENKKLTTKLNKAVGNLNDVQSEMKSASDQVENILSDESLQKVVEEEIKKASKEPNLPNTPDKKQDSISAKAARGLVSTIATEVRGNSDTATKSGKNAPLAVIKTQFSQIKKAIDSIQNKGKQNPSYLLAKQCALDKFQGIIKIMESVNSVKWFAVDSSTNQPYKPHDILLKRMLLLLQFDQKREMEIERYNTSVKMDRKLIDPMYETIKATKTVYIDKYRKPFIPDGLYCECDSFNFVPKYDTSVYLTKSQWRYMFESSYEVKKLMMQEMYLCLRSCSKYSCCDLKEWMENDPDADDVDGLADSIAGMWNRFYKTSNEIWSDPIPVTDADEIFDNVNIKEVISKQIYSTIKTPTFWVAGAVKFNFSAGVSFSGLVSNTYKSLPADSFFVHPQSIRNDSIKVPGKRLVQTSNNKFDYGVTTLLHAYITTGIPVNVGVSIGLSVNNELASDLLFGGSLMFGRKERLVLSAGVAVGKRQLLNKELNYSKADGSVYDASRYADTEITSSQWSSSWFISVTYNIMGKNNVLGVKKSSGGAATKGPN